VGSLSGKRALITGGASGIGRATALLFAREGAAVSVGDIDEAGGQDVAQRIRDEGGQVIFVRCDVSQGADCQHAVQRTWEELGGLDILFNNAGIIRRATVIGTTEEEWDRVMAVNVKSIFLMSKYAIPVMVQSGGGVIINTASGWGLVGGRNAVSYCASKGAVVNRSSWQGQPTVRCGASANLKTSLRRCSIWPVTPRPSSPAQHWSWMEGDWQDKEESYNSLYRYCIRQ
jgi:NAD(P)-dependent dehydrogenase (short-subunit alcohol dehydrogenase family)